MYSAAVSRFGKRLASALAAACVLSASGGAAAQEASDEGYYYTEYERSWYGWQTLAVDVPTMSVFFFTLREGERTPAYTSLVLFNLGGPAVHAAHDRWKIAALSGLTRVTFSLVGAVGFQKIAEGVDGDASEDAQRAAGVLVSNLLPMAMDAFLLGYEDKETRVELGGKESGGWWVPQVGWTGRGGWIGVGGGF